MTVKTLEIPSDMASKKAVNLENLGRLGAKRLAELLLDISKGNADIKRRLRLELAGQAGAEVIAADINMRLASLQRARSFVDWPKRRAFVKDIDLQREMIVDKVAPTRPDLALDLMWRFMGLAEPTLNRVDDSYGDVGDVFRQACLDLGRIAAKASPDPINLADRVFDAVITNDYGEYDQLVAVIFPALTPVGTDHLKTRLATELAKRPAQPDRYDSRAGALRRSLQDLADGEGDVDAYVAHESDAGRRSAMGAAEIAKRLLAVDRADEALAILEGARVEEDRHGSIDWEEAWVAALLATGRKEDAQAFRWSRFERQLSVDHLRAYLKALPDFEDVKAEQQAFAHALGYQHFSTALGFFMEWKTLRHAASLVLDRHAEIDGNLYFILDPAARELEGKHPLAATLLRRAMIDDTLGGAKSKRYRHAARHLLECRALDAAIDTYAPFEAHEAFIERIRGQHGRKTGFWGRVDELASPTR
ncbi:MAG: hypothetical protein OET79_07305 [Nitrospirota bacterium]|nr:hypothetical protein [Nitrospirota bacterium]